MLPHRLGSDIDIQDVRAVADLARLEEWDEAFYDVLPSIQDKTSLAVSASNKLTVLSPYIALIGLASIVAVVAVVVKRRKI